MVFAIELGVAMILAIPITYVMIHLHNAKDRKLIFGDKSQSNEDDNPLLLTIKAMEGELDELRQNNAYLKHIQNLEKQIKEAKAHAEALSKVAGNYGSTMEEVGESIQHVGFTERVDGNTLILSSATDSHEAFGDGKPDWEGYTNSLLNKDHNLISHTKGSIYQGDHKDIQGLLDYIEEELRLTGDTCLRFGSRTRFFSVMILLHNLSLDEFKNKVSYWGKSYDVLLAYKESYGVNRKMFEQEVFNFEEFRQAVLSYFKGKEEVFDEELTRQNTAIYRTYTRQAGWSTYYDVELK